MPKRIHDGLKKRCPRSSATGKRCARKDWPKCSHAWYFSWHHGKAEHRFSLDVIAKARNEQPPRSNTDAIAWRDRLRSEIRSGTNPEEVVAAPPTGLTIGDVADRYLSTFVGKRETERGIEWTGNNLRPSSARQADSALRVARACLVPAAGGRTVPFEGKPIADVTKADIDAIRDARRPLGEVGCNRLLARVRHLFNWAIVEGYTERTPFKRQGVVVVKLTAETPRARRLEPGQADRLLAHANPLLRSLMVAALYTGCRVGELLSLQWSQIRVDERGEFRWIELTAAKTKTGKARTLPVGPRLRAELAMRRQAPDGKPHPPTAYVFGNEVGERVKSVKRGWEACVLRSHGHQPRWVKGKPGQLTADCREKLRTINLHFHDLRREFACTLWESAADLHDVRDFLGHANITTTSRSLP